MARAKDLPRGAFVAATTFAYGRDQRLITIGDVLLEDDEAVRLYPDWFARAGQEDGPTEEKIIARMLDTQGWQPEPVPVPVRDRPTLTGMVRARCSIVALLPPDPGHDGPRSVRVQAGDVVDADTTEIVVDADNFEEVA
jgi:hypothetical protein